MSQFQPFWRIMILHDLPIRAHPCPANALLLGANLEGFFFPQINSSEIALALSSR